MTESPIALLRAHSRHAPWNARGLASHVTGLVDSIGVRPTNASARAAPSARSIRYYIANGLLDRPEGTGTAATYGYRHFLQLLAVKIRQREGATLETIRKEMKELTGDSLERRVATSLANALGATPETRRPMASSCTSARIQRTPATIPSSRCVKRFARPWDAARAGARPSRPRPRAVASIDRAAGIPRA